jgi:hypothetical protein
MLRHEAELHIDLFAKEAVGLQDAALCLEFGHLFSQFDKLCGLQLLPPLARKCFLWRLMQPLHPGHLQFHLPP